MSNQSTIPTPATPDVCTMVLLIDGIEISGEFHVVSISITREINRIPAAIIQLRDGEASRGTFEASNTEHFIPGKKIEIQLGYRSINDSVFQGIIIKHSIKIRKNSSLLIVECRDEAVRMTGGKKSRFHTDNTKDSDIMEELIGSYQLQKEVDITKPELNSIVQYESTDWDFLLCRAESNGLVVIVEDGKVRVTQPATGEEPVVSVCYGSTILELDAEIDARWQSKGIKASSWDVSEQEILEVDAQEPSIEDSGNIALSDLSAVIGENIQQIRHGGELDETELQVWVNGRLLKERLAKVRGRAKFQGFAEVLPGKIIEVMGIGERFEGQMYVSAIRHTLINGNWETDVQFGLNPELFVDTYNLHPLPASGLLPAVAGLQIGIVTVLEDDPRGEDRIKVKLPLVDMVEEGIWARIATLDAGKDRGTFFRPDIGDEVIVGFLSDDPCDPVILGMCHSSTKPAPEPALDKNYRKGYVSREKMQFIFDDEKKIITIETPRGNKMRLTEEGKGIHIEDQNGNKVILNNEGIELNTSKDLTLKAGKNIKLEGKSVEIKAKSSFKASANSQAEVSGANTTIKGNATTAIQGGIVQIN